MTAVINCESTTTRRANTRPIRRRKLWLLCGIGANRFKLGKQRGKCQFNCRLNVVIIGDRKTGEGVVAIDRASKE